MGNSLSQLSPDDIYQLRELIFRFENKRRESNNEKKLTTYTNDEILKWIEDEDKRKFYIDEINVLNRFSRYDYTNIIKLLKNYKKYEKKFGELKL